VAIFAVLSEVISRHHTADLVTVVNLILAVGGIVTVLAGLQRRLTTLQWWIAAFALVSFAPLMSTVWWKQFNLIALVAAAGGFELARRGRRAPAALLIAFSVSIKPLVFVLPLVMLARKETRRVAAAALAGIVVIDVAAQALFALRAGHLGALDPTTGPRNLIQKTSAAGNPFLCLGVNFSPTSMLCRLNGGFAHWTLQRILVIGLVLFLGLFVAQALRGRSLLSWDWFCFLCPFAVLLSALSWAHYQIMLAPLLLLLFVRLCEDGSWAEWAGLIAAFVLASLLLAPFGNLVDAIRGQPENLQTTNFLDTCAQFAQYVVVLTATFWYARHPLPPARAAPALADPG
jgi:hypothetical protein